MSFINFKSRVTALINRSGQRLEVIFLNNEEIGKHFAYLSNGIIIVGNPSSMKITVRWGSGHTAMAKI